MDTQRLLEYRLHNQLLNSDLKFTVEETVQWMGAVQGQDYAPGLWAIGIRTPTATRADILQSLANKKIARSWTMRHTIHFAVLDDIPWIVQLTKERMLKRYKNHMKKEAGLEERELNRSLEVIQKALEGKKLLSRPLMRQAFEEAGIDTSQQRLYHLLWYAAQSGLIFIGPMEGKQQTFGLLAEWAPTALDLTKEEALQKLAERYLKSHGPASVKDFAWWSGLTQKEAKVGFHLADSQLFDREDNGEEYWYLPTNRLSGGKGSGKIHLIYSLDEFLIGYKDRTAIWPEAMQAKLDPKRTGYVFPILFEGEVVGSWKPTVKKEALSMDYVLTASQGIPIGLLEQSAKEYSNFFDTTLTDVNLKQV